LTGLLIALPKTKGDSEIKVHNLKSKPYVDLTLKIIEDFGVEVINQNYETFRIKGNQNYKAQEYNIEGDWSSAAFLIAAGLIGGKTEVTGIRQDSKQGDKRVLDALKSAGGKLTINEDSVIAEKSELKAFEFDATDCPDLFPPLVTIAAYCEGTSKIEGVNRLIYKESNRADALVSEFSKMGISVKIENDTMLIEGGQVKSAVIESHNDHRIAMAAAIAALGATGDITILDAECVNKSYPKFYFDLFKASLLPSRISKRRR
jgi:3-phosphoshikimate 1-carboxyvinyltransferase